MSGLISVIIPIYNAEKTLGECLDSIRAQDFTDMEVILVDDGSTDGSAALCDRCACEDVRFKVLHKQNGGLVSARKAGIAAAHGAYTAFADADDCLCPDRISSLFEAAGGSADMVLAGYTGYREGQKDVPDAAVVNEAADGRFGRAEIESLILPCMLCTGRVFQPGVIASVWTKLFRTELLRRALASADEAVTIGEDAVLTYRCLLEADEVVVRNDLTGYRYRIVQTSMTHHGDRRYAFHMAHLFRNLEDTLSEGLASHPQTADAIRGKTEAQILQYELHKLLQGSVANADALSGGNRWRTLREVVRFFGGLGSDPQQSAVLRKAAARKELFEEWQSKAVAALVARKTLSAAIIAIRKK
ncbi:MAG: glycosyltransferase family 2 protein [Lachnospiraceae bacterium]|jgi:glycosyltransferase involved in cell wall biosynthesis|nr:glycosyltransferase family 2 protein [Lachnospiraceae bacterium]